MPATNPQQEIRAQLTAPGAPFEIAEEEVLGTRLPVFKTRLRSLPELLEGSAVHGEKEFMVYGDQRISYAEHHARVAALAANLRERYGIGPGDRVALLAANCPEFVIAFFAVVSLGAIASAFNGWWVRDEILYGLEDSEPRLLIGDTRRLARLEAGDTDLPVLEMGPEFDALSKPTAGCGLPEIAIEEDDPALILYTSGTTGRPKGAVNTHRGILGFLQCYALTGLEGAMRAARAAEASGESLPAPVAPCVLATVPLFHLSGLYAATLMMLAVGGKTVFRAGRFDPEAVLQLIEKERVSIWTALGNTGWRIVQEPTRPRYDTSSLRNVGFGGAPTSPALQEALREAFPSAAQNQGMGYGLSESSGIGTIIGGAALQERPTSAGQPVATHAIEIRDAADRRLPDGEDGEIHIQSPYLMKEYWRRPKATAETLKPGRWLATGDIGRLEDGWLYINSRARDMILRGGENIYPAEIEHRLDAHADVAESAIVGIDHPELGQEVKAFVVVNPGAAVSAKELTAFAAETLSAQKVPAHWEIGSEPLPRNAAGKVLKNVLTGEATNTQLED